MLPKRLPHIPMRARSIPGLHSNDSLQFMVYCCRKYAPNHGDVVNLGVLFGRSTALLCYAFPTRKVFGIDVWRNKRFGMKKCRFKGKTFNTEDGEALARANIQKRGYEPIILTHDSRTPPEEIGSVAVLFIDTCHRPNFLQAEYNGWLPKLFSGSLVMLHDYKASGCPKYSVKIEKLFINSAA